MKLLFVSSLQLLFGQEVQKSGVDGRQIDLYLVTLIAALMTLVTVTACVRSTGARDGGQPGIHQGDCDSRGAISA